METTPQKPQDIVNTTDSLEAINACKSMKNFLFMMIFIGLLLPQIVFWMNNFNLIKQKNCKACDIKKMPCQVECTGCPRNEAEKTEPAECEKQPTPEPAGPVQLAAPVNVAEEVEKVTEAVEKSQLPTVEAVEEKEIVLETAPEQVAEETPTQKSQEPNTESQAKPKMDVKAFFVISCNIARALVAACNFVVLISAILYSLTLLICLKISLTGRLGGINHIARAFFISLVLLVVLIPWQRIMPGVLVGIIWLPGELLCGDWCKAQCVTFWKVLYYLRFTGLWFLAMCFLFRSQSRSGKWAGATLRRLGVVR